MNSDYNLVDGTFCWCVEKKLHRKKLFRKDHCCRVIHDIWHANGLIRNGGFHRFFDISTKAIVRTVVDAYQVVDLNKYAALISAAEQAYNASKKRLIDQTNDADADSIRASIDDELSLLEREFYDANDLITEKLARYIEKMNPRAL